MRFSPYDKIGIIFFTNVNPFDSRKIGEILRKHISYSLIEEILLRKATSLRLHLEKNKKDLHNKRSLQLIESKIRKLARYYQRRGVLSQDWKYR